MANKRSAGRPHGGDLFRDEVSSVLADLQGLAEELTPGVSVSTAQPDAEERADAPAEVGAEQSVTAIEAAEQPTGDTPEADAEREPAPTTPWSALPPAASPPAEYFWTPGERSPLRTQAPWPAEVMPTPAPPPMPARELIPAAGSEFPLDGGEPRRPPLPPPLFQEESTAGWRLRTLAAPGSVETATRAPTPEESLSAMEDAWPLELDIKLLQPPAQPAPSPTDEPANPAHGPAPAPDGDGTALLPAGEERPRAWGTRRPSMTTVIASGFPPDGPRPGLLPSGGAAETTLVSIQPWTMAAAMAPLVPLTPPPARPGGAPHVDAPGTELSASHIGTSRPPAALIAVGTALLLVLVAVILFIRLHLHV